MNGFVIDSLILDSPFHGFALLLAPAPHCSMPAVEHPSLAMEDQCSRSALPRGPTRSALQHLVARAASGAKLASILGEEHTMAHLQNACLRVLEVHPGKPLFDLCVFHESFELGLKTLTRQAQDFGSLDKVRLFPRVHDARSRQRALPPTFGPTRSTAAAM